MREHLKQRWSTPAKSVNVYVLISRDDPRCTLCLRLYFELCMGAEAGSGRRPGRLAA